jgi:putative membrane-bound dehydrogenase-like protein
MRCLLVFCFTPCCLLAQQTSAQSLKGLKAAPGIEITLWASEPDLFNPTNIDVDERGRVWVLEGVNYRRQLRNEKDYRANGDRILILEDTDGDGRADKVKVFDQAPALRSPLGIAVLGNRVVISQSPDVIVYTKDDQDRILKKEVLLTGWRGVDHDHGVHAIIFGPDGRYYFNSGDQGFDVTDKSGHRFASSRQSPYFAGCALRVNPDGSGFKVLAHDFRNPYELALDSFGNIWQTDNDDDGNAWVRVNYVMEGGNYGYWGAGGRSWQEDHGTHFHSELPGVVPNIARTGAGAPCGLVVYEGKLLPEKYRGQLLHAEAGKRLINTYLLSTAGAGYSMTAEDTVKTNDTWFRPSDVAIGPDGAVYIADWYDPGVGGHLMRDITRGHIYRLAPPGYRAQIPKLDLETPGGLATALRSPAQSVRYLAWTRLKEQGEAALPALQSMCRSADPVLRARALWLIGALGGEGQAEVERALHDPDPRFRILAMRVSRLHGADVVAATGPLLHDASPQVRREIAVLLQDVRTDGTLDSLVQLCKQYDGKDRWYLEALGIAARGRENALYARLKGDPHVLQFAWEFRPSDALPYLISHLRDSTAVVDALAVMPQPAAGRALAKFLVENDGPAEIVEDGFARLAHQLFSEWIELRKDPAVEAAVRKAFRTPKLQAKALELASDLGDGRYLSELETLAARGEPSQRAAALRAIGFIRPPGIEERCRKLMLSQEPNEMRTEAVRILGRTEKGLDLLLDLQAKGELPPELKNTATQMVNMSRNPQIRARAQKILPPLAGKNKAPLPPVRFLLAREGNVARGKHMFEAEEGPKCSGCHSVGGRKKVGPDLASIGTKLGREALLDAILNPSAGIAPEFTMWVLETKTQGDVIGVISEDTPQRVVVRTDATEEVRLKPAEIKARRKSRLSMMPEDLPTTMTDQQLVDVLAYLETLRQ